MAEDLSFEVRDAMGDVLLRAVGKKVELKLARGESVSGKIAAVGPNLVRVSELSGREFFDAIVSLDDVLAVVFRARDA